jgi:hypothetical protein
MQQLNSNNKIRNGLLIFQLSALRREPVGNYASSAVHRWLYREKR